MSKKWLYLLIGIIGILLLVILVLVSALFGKNKTPKTEDTNTATKSATSSAELKFDNPSTTTDPIGDAKGPFYHDLYLATSKDGLNFSGSVKILEHASVPDIIKLPDGKIAIYAVEAARRSRSGLLVSISEDEGKTWKTGSVKFTSEVNGGADPEVVLTNDGKIRLYFITFGQKPGEPPNQNSSNFIKSAISTDGITFTPEEGNRFEFAQMTDPDIVKIGDKWFGYISQGKKNIAITSANGETFSLSKTIREDGSVSNTVSIGNGYYRQFYCGTSTINSALTSDGLNFTNESGSRIADAPAGKLICDPAPIKVSNGWLLVYKVANQ